MENKEDLVGKDVRVFSSDMGDLSKCLSFEITVDSLLSLELKRKAPYTLSPKVTSSKTMAQCQDRDLGIDAIKIHSGSVTVPTPTPCCP